MKKTAIALSLALCASSAGAVSNAVCYPGGFQFTLPVLSQPLSHEGSLSWLHDDGLAVTTTVPCIAHYEEEPMKCSGMDIVAVFCYAYGNIVYRNNATNVTIADGVFRWIEVPSGHTYASTLGCFYYEFIDE